ncbi:type II toxin-antitoxin system RelE/ParE family toxin [Wenyingzhuangia sp. IMCC45467]
MGLKIYWTEFAETELEEIFKHYKEKAGIRVAKKLVNGILNEPKILENNYEIGQREELLIHRKENFRYIIYKSYKIIYHFNKSENRIDINDVFDTRQYPLKIKRNDKSH